MVTISSEDNGGIFTNIFKKVDDGNVKAANAVGLLDGDDRYYCLYPFGLDASSFGELRIELSTWEVAKIAVSTKEQMGDELRMSLVAELLDVKYEDVEAWHKSYLAGERALTVKVTSSEDYTEEEVEL